MIEKNDLIKCIISNYDISDIVDEDDESVDDSEGEELTDEELEDDDNALEHDEEQDDESEENESDDDEEDESDEDSEELTEQEVLKMPIGEIMIGMDQDTWLSLINDQIGQGILEGSVDFKDGQIIIEGRYEQETEDEGSELVTENVAEKVTNLDELLASLNKIIVLFKENLASDEGMEFFGGEEDEDEEDDIEKETNPRLKLVKQMRSRMDTDEEDE